MAKLTLADLSSLENQTSAISTINANSALIETALENTLSRDGTSPNAMEANLDMNNNRILNLPEPVADQEPVRLMDIQGFVDDAEDAAADAEAALASFSDIWLGNSTADPTLDLNGSALDGGEIYYNTVVARLRVYKVGTGWVDVAPFEDLVLIAGYVLAAAASATAALTSENNAADSAADALADRIAAGVSAIAAAGSATQAEVARDIAIAKAAEAAASAATASTHKDTALAAATAAEAALDSFDDRYLGEKGAPPLLDNDGNALVPGALYYDAGSSTLKFYNGTIWVTLSNTGLERVQDDIDPHLGNDLDLNGFDIIGTGNIIIDGDIDITGFIHAAGGTIDFDSNVNIDGTFNVEGATTIDDTLDVSGAVDIVGTLDVAGATVIDDTFRVTGLVDFDNNVNMDGTLQVDLGATFSSTVNIVGQLDGTTAIFSGLVDASDVTVDDEAYGVGWNGSVEVPTKNAVYDQMEAYNTTITTAFNDHLADTVDAHDASAISFSPTGALASTDVQAALAELDTEKQPIDADLTSWAAIVRASGFDTFVATPSLANLGSLLTDEAAGLITFMTTPSSANLRSLLTDESGTGAAYFQGGDLGTPSAGVGTNLTGIPLSAIIDSTSEALGVGSLEVGHASDTTITRVSAGKIAVEGSNVLMESGNAHKKALVFILDGGGVAITTGIKADIRVPWACTITKQSVIADVSGSIVLDIWKDTYANYPPVVGDTITASAKPTLSSAITAEDSTLTGWTTSIAAGDTLRINVDSASTLTRVTLTLEVTLTQ
jgi:cytoskeletal protein CcmA (bactofilin family)